jgi:hypothetical protein
MKKSVLIFIFAWLLCAAPSLASAQTAEVEIHLALPAAPPLVVVQPGVQVVEDCDDEVFFSGGWYWARRGPYWYRARHPHEAFVRVEQRRVPVAIVRAPPGHYRHWHREHVKVERRRRRHHEHEARPVMYEPGRAAAPAPARPIGPHDAPSSGFRGPHDAR